MSVLLRTAVGKEVEVQFPRGLDWPEWYLLHVRLNSEQQEALSQGASLTGIRLYRCLRPEQRKIYLDNLAFYMDPLKPVPTYPQPRPNVTLAEGQDYGVQSGEERLPFPTRKETLLPEHLASEFTTEVIKQGGERVFRY